VWWTAGTIQQGLEQPGLDHVMFIFYWPMSLIIKEVEIPRDNLWPFLWLTQLVTPSVVAPIITYFTEVLSAGMFFSALIGRPAPQCNDSPATNALPA
ncbi:MAG: hypothetical protein ACREOH_18730, partial [Candidatus Entotheonellia bacterium]